MEQVPTDTAKQILQSRAEYEKQAAIAATPLQFSQSQMTIGAHGQGQGSFLAGIQYRQAVKGETERFKKEVGAAKDIFETSVAKGAPEYGIPTYVEKEYSAVQSKLQTQLTDVENKIKNIESGIQSNLSDKTGKDRHDYLNSGSYKSDIRRIEELNAEASGYREGLGMSKFEAIKAGQGDYFEQLAGAYGQRVSEKFRVQDLNAAAKEAYYLQYPEAKAFVQNPAAKSAEFTQKYNDYFNRVLKDYQEAMGIKEPTADLVNKVTKQAQQYIIQEAKQQGITLPAFAVKPTGEPTTITGGGVDIKIISSTDKTQNLPVGIVTTTAPTLKVWGTGPSAYTEYATLGTSSIDIGGNVAEKLSGHVGALK
jgi:hypothetical protein